MELAIGWWLSHGLVGSTEMSRRNLGECRKGFCIARMSLSAPSQQYSDTKTFEFNVVDSLDQGLRRAYQGSEVPR